MSKIPTLLKEIEQEANTTHKFLSALPDDKFDWKPHEKSMTIRQLATHLAELPGWVNFGLTTDVLDFAKNHHEPKIVTNAGDTIAVFEKALSDAKTALSNATEKDIEKDWTMRNGDTIFFTITKAELIRMSISQTIHHRAQLGVCFRLLGIPVPPSYGPTADFPNAY